MQRIRKISRKVFGIAAIALFGLISGCSQIKLNDDSIIQETRILEEYNAIEFNGIGHIHIAKGENASITIVGQSSYLDKVKTIISDKTLKISVDPNIVTTSSDPNSSIQFYISFIRIKSLSLDGNYTMHGDGISSEMIKLDVRGVGPVNLDNLECDRLDIDLSGGGVITITGAAAEQQVVVSGAHIYNAANLKSNTITANLSGQSNTILWAEETLNLVISESASVGYFGNLETMSSISELGHVRFLGLK